MELTQLLNAGGVAGLAVGLVEGVLRWLLPTSAHSSDAAQPTDKSTYPLLILLHLLGGVGVGLLFWLSWGLAALVRVSWWERGLAFATLVWAVSCLPYVLQLYLTQRLAGRTAIMMMLQRGYGLCVVSLACAWSWGTSS